MAAECVGALVGRCAGRAASSIEIVLTVLLRAAMRWEGGARESILRVARRAAALAPAEAAAILEAIAAAPVLPELRRMAEQLAGRH